MTKRMMIRIVSLSIAAAIISSATALLGWQRASAYKRSIENNYQRAFSELVTSMSGINYALQKSAISTSPSMLVSLGSEVFRQSAAATSALSQLPLAQLRLEKTSKFISQVGDWAYSLAKNSANGTSLSAEEREILSRLAATANALSVDLNDVGIEINEGDFHFGQLAEAELELSEDKDVGPAMSVAQNIAYLEQEFPEYPTLIYDGPFSEHIDQKEVEHLQGKKTVSEDEAARIASEFLGINRDALEFNGKNGGKLPVYTFSAERDGGEISIDITCQGGIVLEMTDSRTPGTPTMNFQQATQKAKDFLRAQGYGQMKESYWTVYSDMVMINFAPVSGDVVLYPDLIKVSVALDDGRICNFESHGYIMNHKPRDIPPVGITLSQAKEKIVEGLSIKGYNLAVIPTSGTQEKFVYEIQCERKDKSHCLVYLDAETGEEVQIFILIEDENGVLAM